MHTDKDIAAGIEATTEEVERLDKSMRAINMPGYNR
jgi:hypothetical protein